MKINNFRVDLTDISAEKEALPAMRRNEIQLMHKPTHPQVPLISIIMIYIWTMNRESRRAGAPTLWKDHV